MTSLAEAIAVAVSPFAAAPVLPPPQRHVIIVTLENSNYADVVGSTSMPYLNSLISGYVLATNYYADTHPSIGNYFMMTAGQVITNDDAFVGTVSADNIVRHLTAAGLTWKAYAEGLLSVGYTGGDSGLYAKRHNPLSYFSDVTGAQLNNLVPFTQFAVDRANGTLPNYSFVVPNLNDDIHDGTQAMADAWLHANIDPLVQAMTATSLLVIVFDESASDNTNGGGRVACSLIGPAVKRGFQSTALYQHENLLRTCCDFLGISAPGAGANAPSMLGEALI